MKRWLPLLACVGLTLVARQVQAGASDTVGLSPRDMGLGLSMAARPSNYAAYSNPAALAPGIGDDEDHLELGFVYAHPQVYAQRLGSDETVQLITEPIDTAGLSLGVRIDAGSLIGVEGLGFGVAYYQPSDNIFRWSIHPDDKVQWLFLTDRTQQIGIHAALAYRPWRFLSLGLGMRVLFDTETFTTGEVISVQTVEDEAGESIDVQTELGEEVRVYGRVAPNAGLWIEPIDELRIGLVYRGKLFVDDWGWTRIQGVPGSGDLGYVHRFSHYFHPHTVVAAVNGQPLPSLWLSFDATWGRWSEALTTNHAELGPGRFGDTVTLSFGASWEAAASLRVLGGYRYVPSPFDNFGGPTNLLDSDQHVASTGAELELGTLQDTGIAFRLSWALRIALLTERQERKDPRRFATDVSFLRNPGLVPYRYGGAVPGGSLSLGARW